MPPGHALYSTHRTPLWEVSEQVVFSTLQRESSGYILYSPTFFSPVPSSLTDIIFLPKLRAGIVLLTEFNPVSQISRPESQDDIRHASSREPHHHIMSYQGCAWIMHHAIIAPCPRISLLWVAYFALLSQINDVCPWPCIPCLHYLFGTETEDGATQYHTVWDMGLHASPQYLRAMRMEVTEHVS